MPIVDGFEACARINEYIDKIHYNTYGLVPNNDQIQSECKELRKRIQPSVNCNESEANQSQYCINLNLNCGLGNSEES